MKWVTQYHRLTKLSRGISAKFMRWLFNSVAVPKMLYADNLLIPGIRKSKGTKGFIGKLCKVQRQTSLHITSMMWLVPTDTIDACADLLPFHLLI